MSEFPRIAQGIQTVLTATIEDSTGAAIDFSASPPALVAEVWPGSTLPVTFSPAATWNNAALGTVDMLFTGANTAAVLPGHFSARIRAADSSLWLWQGFVEIVASPSSTAVSLPDLCTIPFAHAALSAQPFSDDEWQFLPWAIKSASAMIRRYCNRIFNRQTHTEILRPEYDGSVRLKEIPVNVISRVASNKTTAITISCSSDNQQARVVFATTGNRDEPGGITVTGLTLTRVQSGTTYPATILWTDCPLVSDLANAVNGLGGGWTATVGEQMGPWSTSELVGGETAVGCLAGSGSGGALLVYQEDLDTSRTDYHTGFVWVGYPANTGGFGPRWGPDWLAFDDHPLGRPEVRVTYDAGFDAVPDVIQAACADVAMAYILGYRLNPLLKSENAHQYSYTLNDILSNVSPGTRQALALYRIHNA